MKTWATYIAAVAIGCATPVLVLWMARSTPIGSDPALAGAAVVLGLGIISALLTVSLPRHWLPIAVVVSAPLCLFGMLMFAVLANVGELYWIWLWVGIGGVAASLLGAYLCARAKRA